MNLNDLFKIPTMQQWQYKVHTAMYSPYSKEHPMDVYLRDKQTFKEWNEWRGVESKDDFNQQYIIGLIRLKSNPDKWLFVGVYKVIERYSNYKSTEIGYQIELTNQFEEYIDKVIIDLHFHTRHGRACKLQTYINHMSVDSILPIPYKG